MHFFFRNYKMIAKIHFSIRLYVLGRTTQVQLPSSTFVALYSRKFGNFHFLMIIVENSTLKHVFATIKLTPQFWIWTKEQKKTLKI